MRISYSCPKCQLEFWIAPNDHVIDVFHETTLFVCKFGQIQISKDLKSESQNVHMDINFHLANAIFRFVCSTPGMKHQTFFSGSPAVI